MGDCHVDDDCIIPFTVRRHVHVTKFTISTFIFSVCVYFFNIFIYEDTQLELTRKMADSESDSDIQRVILTPRKRLTWTEVEMSLEEIKRDWRIRAKLSQKFAEVCEYYCAYGTFCPAKTKIKNMPNGIFIVSTNGIDHNNQRTFDFGLTEEQKKLVFECLKWGVTTPSNILVTFKKKKLKESVKKSLCIFLNRNRRQVLQTCIENDIGDVIVWCKSNQIVPTDPDKPFVISYEIGDASDPNCYMRIFISTTRLLKFAYIFEAHSYGCYVQVSVPGLPHSHSRHHGCLQILSSYSTCNYQIRVRRRLQVFIYQFE